MPLTKRQRIAHWVGLDSERRRRAEIVAQVTARLAAPPKPNISVGMGQWGSVDPASAKAWSAAINAQINRVTGIGKVFYGADLASGKDFGVITTHTAP